MANLHLLEVVALGLEEADHAINVDVDALEAVSEECAEVRGAVCFVASVRDLVVKPPIVVVAATVIADVLARYPVIVVEAVIEGG